MVFSDEPTTERDEPGLRVSDDGVPTVVTGGAEGPARAGGPFGPTGKAREWFEVAYAQAPMGTALVELGPRGERWLLLVNPALAGMLGVDREELVGRDIAEFGDPAYLEEDRRIGEEFLRGERRAYVRHKRYLRPDGRGVWTELRVSRMDLPGHPGVTTLAHFIDVTARHETEEYRARVAATKAAVTSVITRVLAGAPVPEVYALVVDRVARLFDAESVSLLLLDPDSGLARVVAGKGPGHAKLTCGDSPVNQKMVQRLIAVGAHASPLPDPGWGDWEGWKQVLGPVLTAQFGPERSGGLLALGRPPGGVPFEPADVELLMTLGQQVALAIELGQARADQERLAVLEDRHRIARDLHDTVIQDLIAIGMQVDAGLASAPDPVRRERDSAIVDQLEEAVRRLRGSVFDLREGPRTRSLDEGVRTIAHEAGRVLGHRPVVHLEGYLEAVPPLVSGAVLAVVREALSNVARHAGASSTVLHLLVDDGQVRLVVEDDGRGVPKQVVMGDGLRNIRDRAMALGGSATVTDRVPRGTRLTWVCPLPPG